MRSTSLLAGSSVYCRFIYFDVRGAGELCRLTLAASGTEWQDVRYPMAIGKSGFVPGKEYQSDKQLGGFRVNMGNLPILQVVEKSTNEKSPVVKHTLGQSHSICRFIAQQSAALGGQGKLDAIQQCQVDAIYECCRDMKASWFQARRQGSNAKKDWLLKPAATDEEDIHHLPSFCQKLEKSLDACKSVESSTKVSDPSSSSSSSSPFCLNTKFPTLADLAIYHLLATPEPSVVTGAVPSFFDGETESVRAAFQDSCPRIKRCVQAVGELQEIQKWERKRPETFT